ncbi:MAG: hypothetical protein MPW15_22405 [Candidatus Manganitrophus sp.]|nr:hypothetical protein [Candidatus Manganitrophus sp.]
MLIDMILTGVIDPTKVLTENRCRRSLPQWLSKRTRLDQGETGAGRCAAKYGGEIGNFKHPFVPNLPAFRASRLLVVLFVSRSEYELDSVFLWGLLATGLYDDTDAGGGRLGLYPEGCAVYVGDDLYIESRFGR